jgi:SAM-dependent methyltransferase
MITVPASPSACAVCNTADADIVAEQGAVRSNVRAFKGERFAVWRCRACGSIHARDEVDLAHYYARYPFHALPDDWRMRAMYDNQIRRLRRAGVGPTHRILDYGCGAGSFLRHLAHRGFKNAVGYDAYSTKYGDASVLNEKYDCVFSQDLVEHVGAPRELLDTFDALVGNDGVIAVGTPNAAALDLTEPERYVHALHAPYHRHIYSRRALVEAGERRGWRLDRYYPTQYANTLIPFLNSRFYLYYMRLFDNTLDVVIEEPKPLPLLLRLPLTLFWGFFGYFFAEETDVMAIFRKEGAGGAPHAPRRAG